jgi:hypothetical protein
MCRFGDSVAGLRAYMAERNYRAFDICTGKEISGSDTAIDTAFLPN